MENQFKRNDFEITTDPDLFREIMNIPPELQDHMNQLHRKAKKGGMKNIEYIKRKIKQYPNVPTLKNYLSIALENTGNEEKSFEVNEWILKEHPGYLFGLVNKATEYYVKEEYERMPELMGEDMDIKALYPDREMFHLSEVVSFYLTAIMYFTAVGDLEAADSRLKFLQDVAPHEEATEKAAYIIMETRLQMARDKFREEKENRITPEFSEYNQLVQTDQPPEFKNQEINELYRNDFEINQEVLAKILELPRETVISDLRKALHDSICRHEYYEFQAEIGEDNYKSLSFSVHAAFLLGELEAREALNDILETFRQGEDFIEFWYGDLIREVLWLPLYKLGENNLEVFQNFMLEPRVYTYAKTAVSTAVIQQYFHQPQYKEQIRDWYQSILTRYLNTEQENLVDSDLIGFMICNIMEAGFKELLPVIDKLFDAGYVNEEIPGNREHVHNDIGKEEISRWKKDIRSIYQQYNYILENWYPYNQEYRDDPEETYEPDWMPEDTPEVTRVNDNRKIGRNDPCPCGSGKKYKKCCWNKKDE